MSKEYHELTKDNFKAYEKVRKSGTYNMLLDAKAALQVAGLDRRTYEGVQQHYKELKEKYEK